MNGVTPATAAVRPNSYLLNPWSLTLVLVFVALLPGCGGSSSNPIMEPPPTEVPLTRLSTDTFTNSTSQHGTEVEPDTFAFGTTVVSAFQVGRRSNGGASDIGFAVSVDGGSSWTSGFLPGITLFEGGAADAASDPSVAYDAAHGVWMIASLSIVGIDSDAIVSRSTDAIHWLSPIKINTFPDTDKTWVVCDNGAASLFFGHCYAQWENINSGLVYLSTSVDGGLSWTVEQSTPDSALGVGGQPLVQPNGTVVVPILDWTGNAMLAFRSTDGGATWAASTIISAVTDHLDAGGLRSGPIPSAEIDSTGKIYVVWQDCRFRSGCASNDLVLSTSTDGITWTEPARIPIDATTSTVDHFIPGLAVDATIGGAAAHLALIYYFYSNTNCTFSDCALSVGFVSSDDGGITWSSPQALAGPMFLQWLPNTGLGRMVGDYVSASYVGEHPVAAFAVAQANSGSTFDEAIYTTQQPLMALPGGLTSRGEQPLPGARSDHGPRKIQDEEHGIPPRK